MLALLALVTLLLLLQWVCVRRARRRAAHLMRPASEWEAEDLDRWLALIEPFPLPERDQPRRSQR